MANIPSEQSENIQEIVIISEYMVSIKILKHNHNFSQIALKYLSFDKTTSKWPTPQEISAIRQE